MTTRVLTEDQILESYMQIAALEREIVKRTEIARLRAQQANNSQESQKPVTQPENTDKHDTQPEDTYKPGTQPDENYATCDPERDQYDISRTDLTQRPCADGELRGIGPYEDSAGEPRAFPESCDAPSLPRFPTTICKGGVEGDSVKREIEQGINIRQNIGRLDDDGQRGAITVKSTLAGRGVKTKGLASPEELVLPSSKSRIADDLDSGQEPPSSREEPAMCGLLTMRGLFTAEQPFTVHEPFTVDDYNALDNNYYNLDYNFKISDMGTIMKDKGLRLALGG